MTVFRNNPLLMTVMGANPGPRRKRPVDDPIDHAIGQAWHRLMSGIQVSIMDIPRIFRDVKLEMAAGMPLEEAVLRVGQRFRVNRNGYRRNPSLAASLAGGLAGAFVTHAMSNPGPSFIVIGQNLRTGRGEVVYTAKASGTGDAARKKACLEAQRRANATGIVHLVYFDMYGHKRGMEVSVDILKLHGVETFYPHPLKNPTYRARYISPSMEVRQEMIRARGVKGALKKAHQRAERLPRQFTAPHSSVEVDRIHSNPGRAPSRRKITMTIEQFAKWVKAKRDPVMWKAFLAKFKGYEKWTHGSKSRKVTVEWQNVPGVDGLWITYDGGKQPESTYIMPKGSKRKGAWKHPWDTMPDIKHDPEAGVVLTKLRGRSKITDFYHR